MESDIQKMETELATLKEDLKKPGISEEKEVVIRRQIAALQEEKVILLKRGEFADRPGSHFRSIETSLF